MKSRYHTAEQKRSWLKEWKESGLSAKAFSKGRPFSDSSLDYWAGKEKDNKGQGFIRVSSPSIHSISNFSITYTNGVKLEVNQPLSIEQIKSLVT